MNSSSTSPSFEWSLLVDSHGGVRESSFEPVPLFDPANGEASLLEEVHEEAKNEATNNNISAEDLCHDIPAVSRRKKKPRGMPKRPLSAYNLFFQRERPKLLEASGDDGKRLSFEELGKIIGKRWRSLSASEREEYESLAVKDSLRYRDEMESFNEDKKKRIADMDKLDDTPADKSRSELYPTPASAPSVQRSHGSAGIYVPPESDPRGGRGPVAQSPPSEAPRGMEPSHFHPPYPNAAHSHHPYPYYHGEPPRNSPYFPPPVIPSAAAAPPGRASAWSARHPSVDPNMFPIPPGMELMLPDREGRERKYRVQYSCYTMPREAAQRFIEQMAGQMPMSPPPPPPHYQEENRGVPPPPRPPHGAPPPRFHPGGWAGY